ncbi:glycerophosphodiester phosphodiesterase family protein [uncultured Bacteroides sp.]|uniref:glycerophosphodiester phosphodiesterase family protein n=1 Tax=uncultured Bacteroides sp. TaxID=162156 RepID=UPI002AAB281A|nr:glycerophosphodiester phosphodiesterase family protein [uncultured Bacteroides sp.]
MAKKIAEVRVVVWRTCVVMLVLVNFFVTSQNALAQSSKIHSLNIKKNKDVHDYFKYKGDSSILVSGHRGGREKGFSENSLAGFGNVMKQMPAFFEIDPRLTKDSVIVLMHDPTLERTTTGKGRVCDYTWTELKSIRLKDSEGNVTPYSIPTLKEVIKWSKGKTVINLDKKDVPMKMVAALIKKYHAENYVMLTVHNGAQARYYYDRFPNIMFSAFIRTMKEYEDIASSNVPWRNFIAYIGPTINSENENIVKLLHAKGVRCMVSLAPTHDKLKTYEERQKSYKEEINKRPDIIESDIPTEIWTAMQSR